jgi:hypothetical protein
MVLFGKRPKTRQQQPEYWPRGRVALSNMHSAGATGFASANAGSIESTRWWLLNKLRAILDQDFLDQFGKRLFDASQIPSKVRQLVGRTGQHTKATS